MAPRPSGRKTLLLFDGNNLFYRSFFAIPPLATRAGLPTNAVLGFTNVLRKVLTDEPHDFAAVTFDAGGRTFRHQKFPAYKANRPPTPDSLKQQTPVHSTALRRPRAPGSRDSGDRGGRSHRNPRAAGGRGRPPRAHRLLGQGPAAARERRRHGHPPGEVRKARSRKESGTSSGFRPLRCRTFSP